MKTVIAAATCTTFAVLAFGPMPLVAGLAAQAQHSALGDARGEAADRANALFGTYRARCGSVAVVAIDVAAAPAGASRNRWRARRHLSGTATPSTSPWPTCASTPGKLPRPRTAATVSTGRAA